MLHLTRAHTIACGLLIAGALLPATAVAQDAKPEPTSCAGLTFEDPAGDQDLGANGVYTGFQTQDNLDITAGFFRYAPDAAGRNVLTANIRVADLTTAVQPGATGHTYYFYFDLADGTYFVSANLDTAGNFTYGFGDLGISGPGNNETGETTGRTYEGTDGIISIVVPISDLGIEGKSLNTPFASSRVAFSTPVGGLVPTADDGPDDAAGKTFRVTPCTDGVAPPAGDPGAPVVTDPPPVAPQTEQPAAGAPPTLQLSVKAAKLSAKKLRRKRSAVFRLDAGEAITGLTARLFRGSASKPKVVGTGRLASVDGAGRLKVRISRRAARKLRKGTYTLALTGRNAAGQTATATFRVPIRR